MWVAFKTRKGRVYFHDEATGRTQWEPPAPSQLRSPLVANDAMAWQVFVDDRGSTYYSNVATGEVTWHVPPGCRGKQAVNVAKSWQTFTHSDGKRFYRNIMSEELTWHRPPVLGQDAEAEAERFVSNDGDEFFIPDDGFDDQDDEQDDDQDQDAQATVPPPPPARATGETTAGAGAGDGDGAGAGAEDLAAGTAAAAAAAAEVESSESESEHEETEEEATARLQREERALQLRDELHAEEQEPHHARFRELLEDKGVHPHSCWERWIGRLEADERFARVDPESRAKVFRSFTLGLIGTEAATRERRVKACAAALAAALASDPAAAALVRAAGSAAALLDQLELVRAGEALVEGEGEEQQLARGVALELHAALESLPRPKDRERAFKSAVSV